MYFTLFFPAVFGRPQKATETNKTMFPYDEDKTQNGSVRGQFHCSWNCQIIDSNLSNRIQTTIFAEKRRLRLVFHNEKIIDEKCVSQTSRSQSGNITERWQIRLVNYTLPSFTGNVIKSFSTLIQETFELQAKALCTFGKSNSSQKEARSSELSHSNHLAKILLSNVRSLGDLKVCSTKAKQTMQTCIEISEFSLSDQRTEFVLHVLLIMFVTTLTYIAPAIVCLFPATEVTHEGIRQITIEGLSPVAFRSLIGNYFFSKDYTMWHMARKFIMRAVLLPIPFLVPALFVEYLLYQNLLPQQNLLRIAHLSQPFRILCYSCYCIQAFNLHFLKGKPPNAERSYLCLCRVLPSLDNGNLCICSHRELPDRMLEHLRVVGGMLVASFLFSVVFVVEFFGSAKGAFCDRSLSQPVGLCELLVPIVMFTLAIPISFFGIPIMSIMLVEYVVLLFSPVAFFCVSTSVWQLANNNFLHRYLVCSVNFVAGLLDVSISCLSAFGVMFVLRSSAVGVLIFLQLAFTYMLSEENLPFVVCCLLVCCNLWSSNRFFTQKYQDLAVKLFEQYNLFANSEHSGALNTHGITPYHCHTAENVKKIPKELFHTACQELMPIRKTIGIMMVKATLSMVYVFLVFLLTMSMNTSVIVKSLVLFLTVSFPMIVTIFIDRKRRQSNFEEKTYKIVQEYMNNRFNFNREQQNSDARSHLDVSKGENLDSRKVIFAMVVSCFISAVLYWWFSTFRPFLTIIYCLMRVPFSKYPYIANLSEISQLFYRYPLPTSELYKDCCNW